MARDHDAGFSLPELLVSVSITLVLMGAVTSLLVNAAPAQSHLDPLTAAPGKNKFFTTVERFLRRKAF